MARVVKCCPVGRPSVGMRSSAAKCSGRDKTAGMTYAPSPAPPPLPALRTFDSNAFDVATGGHSLSTLGYFLMFTTGLMDKFKLDPVLVARFMRAAEESYRSVRPSVRPPVTRTHSTHPWHLRLCLHSVRFYPLHPVCNPLGWGELVTGGWC